MEGKKLKNFFILETIINIVFVAIIFLVPYLMKDIVWWKVMLVVLAILVINMIVGAINIVIHIKK